MNKVDRLIEKAKPKCTAHDILTRDNPYLGMSYRELKLYRDPNSGKILPKPDTLQHTKYMYAVLQARADRKR